MYKSALIFGLVLFFSFDALASNVGLPARRGLSCSFDENPYKLVYSISKSSTKKPVFKVENKQDEHWLHLGRKALLTSNKSISLASEQKNHITSKKW